MGIFFADVCLPVFLSTNIHSNFTDVYWELTVWVYEFISSNLHNDRTE